MRTAFRRILIPAALVLLCALLAVGWMFQMLVRQHMQEDAYDAMHTTADTVSKLVTAYVSEGALSNADLYLNMTVASRVTGAQTVICDSAGMLVVCSDSPFGCVHQGLVLDSAFVSRVLENRDGVRTLGVIQGLYADARYAVSVPVFDRMGKSIGIVISSISATSAMTIMEKLTTSCLLVSVITVVVSVVLMGYIARKQSSPLQDIARVATDFGHGNLSARARVDKHSSQEMQELALAFNNMADSLEKSENQRRDFIANISHELKTPMTTISGFMDGMLDGTIPPQRQTHYMELVSQETKRLSRLVRSMLDISQLREQEGVAEERKQSFDMAECIGRTLVSFEQKIVAKELEVQVDMPEHPVYTRADQDAITQVVYNLLDNAVKFCPQKGILQLRLRLGTHKIYVSIANSGQTIPPEELPLVFERFHKIDKSRTEKDGWGLGLYIVKTIIGSHGEDISVSSAGDTTEFTFTLPLEN